MAGCSVSALHKENPVRLKIIRPSGFNFNFTFHVLIYIISGLFLSKTAKIKIICYILQHFIVL